MSSQIRNDLSKIAAYLTGNWLVAGSDPPREAKQSTQTKPYFGYLLTTDDQCSRTLRGPAH